MRHSRRQQLVFFVLLALFVMATSSLTGYTLWLLRADAIKSGLQISALLSRSFSDHLTQSIHVTEMAGVNRIASDERQLDARQVQKDFISILQNSPYLRSISLLDNSGRIVTSSTPANIGLLVSTDHYFPVTHGAQSVLRIGQPWAGRDFIDGTESSQQHPVATPDSFIPAIQSIEVNGGQMTLLIAINPDYFRHHILKQLAATSGDVEVLRLDGVLLMSTNPQARAGTRRGHAGYLRQINEVESGEFEQAQGDGSHALSAFRVSTLYPFVVITNIQREYALQNWCYEIKTILGIVGPALLALTVLAIAFYRRHSQLEAQRAKSARLQQINAAQVFTNSHEGILIAALDGTIIDANDAFVRITGYSRDELLGQKSSILKDGLQDEAFYAGIRSQLLEQGFWRGEILNRRKNGSIFTESLNISAIRDDQGVIRQYVAMISDISQRKEMEERVRQLAFYDPLTQLPNRRLLDDRLNQVMLASKRSGHFAALMFLDLDNFKPLNDAHGHSVGDLLLAEVGRRLTAAVREMDTVARFGGDEFVVLLGELGLDRAGSTEQARSIAEKIRLSLSAPYFLAIEPGNALTTTVEHHCSVSIGAVVFVNHQATQQEILKWADVAMYQAKEAGRNLIRFYAVDTPAPP
ncbi:MAG: diguanylate cyclase/phosphodiesterase with PAS/PAC sensor(s) [uncultured bacterium]|nr:MAG: diguanylate cyclase/phosphodiesterase with PAS/PAC sensor(s) [uncultured bacterium]